VVFCCVWKDAFCAIPKLLQTSITVAELSGFIDFPSMFKMTAFAWCICNNSAFELFLKFRIPLCIILTNCFRNVTNALHRWKVFTIFVSLNRCKNVDTVIIGGRQCSLFVSFHVAY